VRAHRHALSGAKGVPPGRELNQMVMNSLKRIVKKILPGRCRKSVGSLYARLNFGLARWALSQLSLGQAVELKESTRQTGRLDYARGTIRMHVDSVAQINRLFSCQKEPETVAWIESFMRPGEVFYDVGANVGAYSFVAHAVAGGDCTVYAFEPSFSTFTALSLNVMLNGCAGKVVPLHVALADETGLLTFKYTNVEPGAALHSITELSDEAGKPVAPTFEQPIFGYRLDDLVRQFRLRPPNHLKLDVDGAEMSVLRGGAETLAHPGLRSVLVEVDERQDPSGELLRYLTDRGFRVHARHPRPRSEQLANYVFER
jgi:FkbM family methyltransferase